MAMKPGDMFYETELIAAAGSKGELRCDVCGIVVTLIDPFVRGFGSMLWLDVDRWVEDGTPKARCRSHG